MPYGNQLSCHSTGLALCLTLLAVIGASSAEARDEDAYLHTEYFDLARAFENETENDG